MSELHDKRFILFEFLCVLCVLFTGLQVFISSPSELCARGNIHQARSSQSNPRSAVH